MGSPFRPALAGIPQPVLRQARERLRELEAQPIEPATAGAADGPQLGLFSTPADHPLLEALEGIEPDALTPRQALDVLYKLKGLLD